MYPRSSTVVFDAHLNHHHSEPLDVAPKATDGRFRLISCMTLIQCKVLRVEEFTFTNIDDIRYATISYPWKGVADRHPRDTPISTFQVLGTTQSSDSINIDVLRDVCIAAQRSGADYIWFDQISVLQDEARAPDKNVQIGRMYEVYSCCMLCIVVPSGLGRLATLDEETPWIQRGWTLQEALAPKRVVVLFAWKLGSGYVRAGEVEQFKLGRIDQVTPGKSATVDLLPLVITSGEGFMTFVQGDDSQCSRERPTYHIIPKIFGSRSPHARALAAAMAQNGHQDMKDGAIWKSAQLRTASRSVDLVLSIMGLFGVKLQVERYGPDDRLRATVDLAKQILDQGRTASWLGVSFQLPPSKYLSTFSVFPRTSQYGGAQVQTEDGLRSVSEFVGGECLSPATHAWYQSMGYKYEEVGIRSYNGSDSMLLAHYGVDREDTLGEQSARFQTGGLRGKMDDEGYLTLKALSVQVRPIPRYKHEDARFFHSVDGRTWKPFDDRHARKGKEDIYSAVFIGVYKRYHPVVYRDWRPRDGDFAKIMVVAEHDSQRHRSHAVTFCVATSPCLTWAPWKLREFTIGGVEPPPRGRAEDVMSYEPVLGDILQADTHELFHSENKLRAHSQKEVEDFFERFPQVDAFDPDESRTSVLGRYKADMQDRILQNVLSKVLR